MYNLICDYEHYISDFGFVSITTFIDKWTRIGLDDFMNIQIGDILYTHNGSKYKAIDIPHESDNELDWYIECEPDTNYSSTHKSCIFSSGDLYFYPVIHYDYTWKKIKNNNGKEEKICPILITKTKQPQN